MLSVISVYQDVARDNVNETENGYFGYEKYNRMSRRAELRMIDYLTGDIKDVQPPMMQGNQKGRDWIAHLVEPDKRMQVEKGKIVLKPDYYIIDNMFLLGSYNKEVACDEEVEEDDKECNTPIEILRSDAFYDRCNSYIDSLRPSFAKPIAKRVGRTYQFAPRDLGTIGIEYVRYPKFGRIVSKIDPIRNEPIADPNLSDNYEWDEAQRELLIWFITDTFALHSREQALQQHNKAAGKDAREGERR